MTASGANREQEMSAPRQGLSPPEFAAQFERSFRVFWLVAMGVLGDAAGAEDVVQESALLALQKLDEFQPGTNFRAWMAQMVRFVALNHARKQHRHRTGALEGLPETNGLADGGSTGQGSELRLSPRGELPPDQGHFDDRVMAALRSIGEVARACLLLRTIEQLEYSEIARVLAIPEGTAMSHVHRARQYLRERLADKAPAAATRKEARP